ncbi:MAG: Dam family site-specific DNA-(adenine-N6)-methyltransferase [Fimbriimonadaceae bacterium]|nr:Dam family site-specific DNA-(adenine-N6)-methyltransferase [Fimbriimonadaceae bacterium]
MKRSHRDFTRSIGASEGQPPREQRAQAPTAWQIPTDARSSALPLLRWPGSKRRVLSVLRRHLPHEMHRYFEPFAGSLCLFFALTPSAASLGDTNSDLIAMYKTLRSTPRELCAEVNRLGRDAQTYYRVREPLPKRASELKRATRFIYLNRMAFNGVYRTNRLGHFNVPMGSRTGSFPSEAAYLAASAALQQATLQCVDFETLLLPARAGDFAYLDPPYFSPGRQHYGEYGYPCFSQDDERRLWDYLHKLDCRGVTFLLSYRGGVDRRRIARNWTCVRVRSSRILAANPGARGVRNDILVTNLRPPHRDARTKARPEETAAR